MDFQTGGHNKLQRLLCSQKYEYERNAGCYMVIRAYERMLKCIHRCPTDDPQNFLIWFLSVQQAPLVGPINHPKAPTRERSEKEAEKQ